MERIADAVIFDLDGTLTDTEKYYQIAWPKALEYFGYPVTPEMPLELRSLGRPFVLEKFREWFGEGFPYDEVRAYRQMLVRELMEAGGIPLKPGALELFDALKAKGIPAALATANACEKTMGLLTKIGIADRFDRILCADMVPQGKPAPYIYEYACRELGLPPERTFAVEDSPNGVKSAYRAGCRVIMVPDLTEPDEELWPMLYRRVDGLAEIIKLL